LTETNSAGQKTFSVNYLWHLLTAPVSIVHSPPDKPAFNVGTFRPELLRKLHTVHLVPIKCLVTAVLLIVTVILWANRMMMMILNGNSRSYCSVCSTISWKSIQQQCTKV